MLNNISIGLFIDGGYYAEVSHAAKQQGHYLGIKQLLQFCRVYLADYYGLRISDCQITEKHFYRGRYYYNDAKERKLLDTERKFEDGMISHDMVFHYKHLRVSPKDPSQLIEKGVDVWFALDTYEIAIAHNLDIVVVMTGDGDHEMLLAKLKTLKKKAVLLTYAGGDGNSVARLLSEEATLHIELDKVLTPDSEYLKYFER